MDCQPNTGVTTTFRASYLRKESNWSWYLTHEFKNQELLDGTTSTGATYDPIDKVQVGFRSNYSHVDNTHNHMFGSSWQLCQASKLKARVNETGKFNFWMNHKPGKCPLEIKASLSSSVKNLRGDLKWGVEMVCDY